MTDVVRTPEWFADSLSKEVVLILETADLCTDPDLLRQALRVAVTAIPDLLVTTEPAPAVLATVQGALVGTWP